MSMPSTGLRADRGLVLERLAHLASSWPAAQAHFSQRLLARQVLRPRSTLIRLLMVQVTRRIAPT
jgi:hypothetical protein